jgi:hypothetical protein
MADIYSIDFAFQNRNLIAPAHRTPKTLALCEAITDSLQDLRDVLFTDYRQGANYDAYNNGQGYVLYDRVLWTDKCIYELIVPTSATVDPTGEALSSTNWRKVIDNYIGADERARYNAQTAVLCSAINKWFGVTGPNYIWIQNYQVAGTSFNINVPLALYNSLGTTNPNRTEKISQFIRKFASAAMVFTVTSY